MKWAKEIKQNSEKRQKKTKQPTASTNSVLKTWSKRSWHFLVVWFTGVLKEFNRITWLKNKKLWEAYGIVIVITILFATLFYIIAIIASFI